MRTIYNYWNAVIFRAYCSNILIMAAHDMPIDIAYVISLQLVQIRALIIYREIMKLSYYEYVRIFCHTPLKNIMSTTYTGDMQLYHGTSGKLIVYITGYKKGQFYHDASCNHRRTEADTLNEIISRIHYVNDNNVLILR